MLKGWTFENSRPILSYCQHTHPLVDVHKLRRAGLDLACVWHLPIGHIRCGTYPRRLMHDRALICQFLFFYPLKVRVLIRDFVRRSPPRRLYYLLLISSRAADLLACDYWLRCLAHCLKVVDLPRSLLAIICLYAFHFIIINLF
jgi:hypothetical protein